MEHSVAIRLVIGELALVVVAVSVPEGTLTVRFVVLPLTLVLGAVLPHLNAETVTHAPCAIIHFITVY